MTSAAELVCDTLLVSSRSGDLCYFCNCQARASCPRRLSLVLACGQYIIQPKKPLGDAEAA